ASDRLRVEVGIVYTNDGHPAEEAEVAAALTGPDGTSVGPVTLERTSGSLYSAEIDVPGPGAWQVSVTSTTPTAQGGVTVEVAESSETTAAPDTEPIDPTDTLVALADEPEPEAAAAT